MENLVAVDWVVDVADEDGVGVGVVGGVEVAGRVLFGEAEDELVDHVERHVLSLGRGVFELDLVVLLHTVESDEEPDSDTEVIVFGIEGGPACRMASGCGEEAAVIDEEHLGSRVADHVVGPGRQFELLCVVGEGEAGHGGGDNEAKGGALASFAAGIGDDVDPGHGGVGVGDDIVAPVVVKAAVLVIEFEVAPDTEFALRLEQRVLDLVLVVLVGDFESAQLFGDGDALLGGEGEAGHGVEKHAFGLGDIRAVEDEDRAGRAVGCPEVLSVGHLTDEVVKALMVATFVGDIVYEDQIEGEAMCLVVFESPEHFLGEAGTFEAVDFHEDDGEVAGDGEAPEAGLGEGVASQEVVAAVAEGGSLCHVF